MNKKEKIILNKIIEVVKNSKKRFKNVSNDGRINSAVNESFFTNEIKSKLKTDSYFLKNGVNVHIPKERAWYDILVESKKLRIYLPINIKITNLSTKSSDNLNCKLGIYYAFTGDVPNFSNQISWESFHSRLADKMMNSKYINKNADYYFLVIDKEDFKNTFVNSLKKIKVLTPNGNNLPFQCCWEKNQELVHRSYKESFKYVKTIYEESLEKLKSPYDSYYKHCVCLNDLLK